MGSSNGNYTIVPQCFHPGSSYLNGSDENERKFILTVYCTDSGMTLKGLEGATVFGDAGPPEIVVE